MVPREPLGDPNGAAAAAALLSEALSGHESYMACVDELERELAETPPVPALELGGSAAADSATLFARWIMSRIGALPEARVAEAALLF